MTSRMKKSEMSSEVTFEGILEVICKATSKVISEVTSKVISESNKFDRRVTLLIDCGVVKDKDWQNQDVKKRIKSFFKTVGEDTEGHNTYDISDIICTIEGE